MLSDNVGLYLTDSSGRKSARVHNGDVLHLFSDENQTPLNFEAYIGSTDWAPLEKYCHSHADDICLTSSTTLRLGGSEMVGLVHCIYASTATCSFSETELRTLIHDAHLKNQGLGVTGILVYMSGRFFQILEGEAPVVAQLYATIERDQRHKEVTQIILESIRARKFRDWSMGLIDLSGDKLRQLVLLADPSSGSLSVSQLPQGRSKKLLLAFCEGRWGPTSADLRATPSL